MKLFLLAIAALSGMANSNKTPEQMLTEGNNHFTTKMFSEVVKQQPRSSVVLSAFSVMTPLAQLVLASKGASHDELLRAIGLPDDEAIKNVFAVVNSKVRSIKGVDLKMASRIYIPEHAQLNDKFQTVSRDVFGTEVKNVDFSKSEETARVINAWVEDQTNKRIKDLVSSNSLNQATRALLVNAIYFKGTWKQQFDPKLTAERDFYVTKDQKVKLPTMYRKGSYLYGESNELDAKLLRLPYKGNEASMLIVLPNEIDGLAALEKKLQNPEALSKATAEMSEYDVDVYLPKFRVETKTDLKSILQAIGVKKIFNPGEAQLTNLLKGSDDMYVSDAIQKAFIEVNEEGAEAAAANAFDWALLPAAPPPPPMLFKVDRPFYFQLQAGNINIFNGVSVHH